MHGARAQTFGVALNDVPKSIVVHEGVAAAASSEREPHASSGTVSVDLLVHDLPGQSFLADYAVEFGRDASLVALVFDITSRASFESLAGWLESVKDVVRRDAPGVIIANKADLEARRQVPQEEVAEFAAAIGYRVFDVCAMQAEQVEAPFAHLAALYYQKYRAFVQSRGAMV